MKLLAESIQDVFGTVTPPPELGPLGKESGATAISTVITNIISLLYTVAAIIFIFMLIFSAIQWLMSGGDKEAVAKARGRITWAIIGITLLALTFVILNVLGQILNIKFFIGQGIPGFFCAPNCGTI